MDAEGISKFWKTKPITKSATTKTQQMEASASSGVSCGSPDLAGAASAGDESDVLNGGELLVCVSACADAALSVYLARRREGTGGPHSLRG